MSTVDDKPTHNRKAGAKPEAASEPFRRAIVSRIESTQLLIMTVSRMDSPACSSTPRWTWPDWAIPGNARC